MSLVKCRICGKRVEKGTAFCVPTKYGNFYYCSIDEYSERQAYLAKIDKVNMIFKDLIGENIIYANVKRFIQKYYEADQIDRLIRYLEENMNYLTVTMNSNSFASVYVKTKYLCTIVLNGMPMFENGEKTEYQKKVEELETLIKSIVGEDVLSLDKVHQKISAYYMESQIKKFISFLNTNHDEIINILAEKQFDSTSNKLSYFCGIVMNNLPVYREGVKMHEKSITPTVIKEVDPSALGADVSDDTPKTEIHKDVSIDIPVQPKKRPKPLKKIKKRRGMAELEEEDD